MPVSKKRKKKATNRSRGGRSTPRPTPTVARPMEDPLVGMLRSLATEREQHETEQAEHAAVLAAELVAELIQDVRDNPAIIVEDELSARLGPMLHSRDHPGIGGYLNPAILGKVLMAAARDADSTVSPETTRTRTAIANTLPLAYSAGERSTIALAGQPLWTRDRYGSRFAIVAPITTGDQPLRWYLWDVDACGYHTFTVHNAYYPTPEAALADWRSSVGEIAAAGCVLAEIDDPWLASTLLPVEVEVIQFGGETVALYGEYFRGRRLARLVRDALPDEARRTPELTSADAAVEFAAWLRAGGTEPADLDDLAAELADSWGITEGGAEVYNTCSPHRVAATVLQLRDYYLDDTAEELVALLPDWTRWLAERNGTPAELADRCLPYAEGAPMPQLGEGRDVEWFGRMVE